MQGSMMTELENMWKTYMETRIVKIWPKMPYKARTKNRRTKIKPRPIYTNSLPAVTGFSFHESGLTNGRWIVCALSRSPSHWPQHTWRSTVLFRTRARQGKTNSHLNTRGSRKTNQWARESCTQHLQATRGSHVPPRFTRGTVRVQLFGYKDHSGWTQNKHMFNTCDEFLFLKRNRIFLSLSLLKITVKMQSHWLLMKSQSWDDLMI